MTQDNPLLQRPPADFYEGPAEQVAEAIREGNHSRIRELLSQSPAAAGDRGTQDLPMLVWAMAHDDLQAVRILLEAGAPPDDFFLVNGARMSILALATGAENDKFLKLLLEHHANPNGLPESVPPLFVALRSRQMDRFDLLLAAGADPNHGDRTNATAVIVAALANDYRLVLRLIGMGADPTVKMTNGTDLQRIIDRFPLPAETDQGKAQREVAALLP